LNKTSESFYIAKGSPVAPYLSNLPYHALRGAWLCPPYLSKNRKPSSSHQEIQFVTDSTLLLFSGGGLFALQKIYFFPESMTTKSTRQGGNPLSFSSTPIKSTLNFSCPCHTPGVQVYICLWVDPNEQVIGAEEYHTSLIMVVGVIQFCGQNY